MSITSELINEKIKDLEHDLEQALKENERARDWGIEYRPSCYEVSSLTIKAISDACIRVENTIRNEIKVLKNCFNDDMINDLDYIIDINNDLCMGDIRLIISTRVDIVKFEESGISEKDYNRDMKTIRNKIDDISKFNPGIRLGTMDIPIHKNEAIKSLVLGLTRGLRGYVKNLPNKAINSSVIKDIITVISDAKRMPKSQGSFEEMTIELIEDLIKNK
ncbi:hypothetical protein ACLHDG_13805 [Sulfurovum sp. CS9]|uniref:hypothetical protein n=1 Tax=Sulfurovum sp. CS9 TaxID=3391146 RepID=UPI0039E74615